MSKTKGLEFTAGVIGYPIALVLCMWIVFWIEIRFHLDFNYLGIYPLKTEGLRGVLFGPFIHSNLQHLFNNSVPLFVLTSGLFYFYRNISWKVLIYGLFLTGITTWLIGRPAYHIGASGVVYMLVAFLFFKGVLSKQFQLIALSLVVVFLYGGLLWYVFPIDPKISWEGHLSGFGIGFLFALIFREIPIENKKYYWQKEDYNPEEDEFLQQFDENGNFIETKPEVEEDSQAPKIQIRYTIRKKDSDESS
tara:strand:- start:22442 stop:23188 length:747 start_codon:yes stop_codon:yes gene_type:complete